MSSKERFDIHLSIPLWKPRLSFDLHSWLPSRGNVLFTLTVVCILVFTQGVWAKPLQEVTNVTGASATTINYQGRLADSGGNPITQTGVAVSFTIFDDPEWGNAIWGPEMHSVDVSNGLFSVGLGSMTAGGIPTSVWNGDRYLEIRVGGETLSPRELIRSVPVAGMALTVPDGAIGSAQIADGAISSSEVRLTHGEIYGSGATLSLTSTPQIVPSLSFTVNPPTNQVIQIHLTLDAHRNWDCITLLAQPYIDSSPVGPVITLGTGNTSERTTISTVRQAAISAGSHTTTIKAWCEQGTGGTIMTGQSSLSYVLFSQ